MDVEAAFPLRFWINLLKCENHRNEMEAKLAEVGLTAERFVVPWRQDPVEASRLAGTGRTLQNRSSKTVGYPTRHDYLQALSIRLALREAIRRKAPAVLLIGDGVMFHSNFPALVRAVELPEDWGIVHLGCTHRRKPHWAGMRMLRCAEAVKPQVFAIHARHFRRVMRVLDRGGRVSDVRLETWDEAMALLQDEIPAYACFPNLAWDSKPDPGAKENAHPDYTTDGMQKGHVEHVADLWDAALFGDGTKPSPEGRRAKLGLLFLTRGDVHHPRIWSEFVGEAPERVRIFSHAKLPEQLAGGFLERTAIRKRFVTRWGCISLVRASRAMLCQALEDESLTHFALLSESCVPIQPLPEILRRLELDSRSQFGFKTLMEASSRQISRAGTIQGVPVGCWRFTSQWWLLDRAAAAITTGQDYTALFEKMEVPDEAYFATVLCMQGYPLDGSVVRKDITWTWWERDAGSPATWPILPLNRLEKMIHSGALFARKFPREADIGKFRLHRSAITL